MFAIQIVGGVRVVNWIRENFDLDTFLPLTEPAWSRHQHSDPCRTWRKIFVGAIGCIDGDRKSTSRVLAAFARDCQRCCPRMY